MIDPPLPSELILFVTSHCHLRCKHCFNWRNLERNKDLTLDEIESLAKSLPNLMNLMISGGEPFLRRDIVDICRIFARHSRTRSIDIPTSGTLVDSTVKAVEDILRLEPLIKLSIGISLDGMEAYHDLNRGIPGTFSNAVECCRRLLELKKKFKRFKVNILTTLVDGNTEELLSLKKYVADTFPMVDNLYWGIARGEVKESNFGSTGSDDLTLIDKEYLEFDAGRKGGRRRRIINRFYELRQEAFSKKQQPVPCVAGRTIAVVYDDGSVAPCELLPPVGNLRDMSFETIWHSMAMKEAREMIASASCNCTHECFLYPSYEAFLLERPLTLLKLGGIDGLIELLHAKYGIGVMVRAIKSYLGRLLRRH